jgi:short-subunit dehydrogenase
MIKNGKGKIVNFGSIASFMGRPDRVAYVAAKTGVLGLTRALGRRFNWKKYKC